MLAMFLAVTRPNTRHETAGAMVVVEVEVAAGGNPELMLPTRKFVEALDNVVKCACNWDARAAGSVAYNERRRGCRCYRQGACG